MKSGKFPKFNRRALNAALASVLTLAGTGLVSNAYAAAATSTATSTVIAPIAIGAPVVLSFGNFSSRALGTITVQTNDVVTVTGGVLRATVGGTASAARFDVTGANSNNYSITHSGATVLTSGTAVNDMALTKISALTAAASTSGNVGSGTLSGAGAQSIFVGGTLNVAAAQVAGVYTGAVTVTVEYN